MAIKTIEYKVTLGGITPATEQPAGTQGDHRVTEVKFLLADELYSAATVAASGGKLMYRFDVYDGGGSVWSGKPSLLIENTVSVELEECHTRHGGKVEIYLVITALSEDNQTEIELYNIPARLRLNNRPEGEPCEGGSHESMTTLAESAQKAAQDAAEANEEAREFAAEVQQKLENGEFNGADGVSATHRWDGTTLTVTSASGTSSADLKGEKGDKGDKGDVGTPGKDAVIDQSFNPESENAQSGKAVAEAVSDRMLKPEVQAGAPIKTVVAMSHNDYTTIIDPDTTIPTYFPNDSAFEDMIVDDGTVHDKENVDCAGGWLATRDNEGNLWTGTPVDDQDCANKAYVDGLVGDIETLLGGI